jgi:hypothetical protein
VTRKSQYRRFLGARSETFSGRWLKSRPRAQHCKIRKKPDVCRIPVLALGTRVILDSGALHICGAHRPGVCTRLKEGKKKDTGGIKSQGSSSVYNRPVRGCVFYVCACASDLVRKFIKSNALDGETDF